MKWPDDIKNLFVMSRHERMGSMVVLLLIALLLAATALVRSCDHGEPTLVNVADINEFDKQTDTAMVDVVTPKPARKHHKDKPKRHHRPAGSPKPEPAPRRVDPVPQF